MFAKIQKGRRTGIGGLPFLSKEEKSHTQTSTPEPFLQGQMAKIELFEPTGQFPLLTKKKLKKSRYNFAEI